jgi:hypothetical protein
MLTTYAELRRSAESKNSTSHRKITAERSIITPKQLISRWEIAMSFSCPVHRIAQVQRRINRKRAVIMSLYGAALLGLLGVIQNPARAAVATLPTAGTAAAASATVAVAAVGGGATIVVQTNGWKAFFGAALATGGLALGVVDPPGGTFFDGSFTYNYPSSLFEVSELGV